MKTCPQCKISYPDDRTFCFVDGSDLLSMVDARIGTTIVGRYRIEDVLGEGGMATVYSAKHTLVERECAVKVMNPMFAQDPVVRERFFREAKNTIKLAHPNVVDIFDHGECEDGTPFLVMEHLRGGTLAQLIEKGAIPVNRAVGLMIQIACGIARAHDLDVVHRDIKPENIFVCRRPNGSDLVKILDFGIARALREKPLTSAGEVFGTPQYMAPERISQPNDAGPSSDLYSIGVVFFEMVTGRLPFEAREIASIFIKHLREAPPSSRTVNSDVPESLDALILRMLGKSTNDRPVDAHKVQEDLTAIAKELGIALPVEPAMDASSSRRAATTLSPAEEGRWSRATEQLQKLVLVGYGATPPADALRAIGSIRSRVVDVVKSRQESIAAQAEHERVAERGREVRFRFGFAVDALGQDASRAKLEEREASEKHAPHAKLTEQAREDYLSTLREIVREEGRSGLQVPSTDLADSYRTAAEAVDRWVARRKDEGETLSVLEEKRRAVKDLEYQIHELRAALAAHERNVENDENACAARVTEASRKADSLDHDLRGVAMGVLSPFLGRTEFEELCANVQRAMAA